MQAGGGSLAYGREGFEPSSCAVAGVLPPTIQLASVTGKITQMALLPGSIHMPPIFINCRALIIVSCHLISWRHADMKPNTLNWACHPSPTNVHTHMCIVKVKNNILGSIQVFFLFQIRAGPLCISSIFPGVTTVFSRP